MEPLVREGLRARRLMRGTLIGVVAGALIVVFAGAGHLGTVVVAGLLVATLMMAAWICSVLYLRTDKGKAGAAEYLTRRAARRQGRD